MTVVSVMIMIAALLVVFAALYFTLFRIGLQEAGDPTESRPEDLTEYEKQHVDRADVDPQADPEKTADPVKDS